MIFITDLPVIQFGNVTGVNHLKFGFDRDEFGINCRKGDTFIDARIVFDCPLNEKTICYSRLARNEFQSILTRTINELSEPIMYLSDPMAPPGRMNNSPGVIQNWRWLGSFNSQQGRTPVSFLNTRTAR